MLTQPRLDPAYYPHSRPRIHVAAYQAARV